jgi:hypothetical protein
MLIQGIARSDSIVASKLAPADFCNNIGPPLPIAALRKVVIYL